MICAVDVNRFIIFPQTLKMNENLIVSAPQKSKVSANKSNCILTDKPTF